MEAATLFSVYYLDALKVRIVEKVRRNMDIGKLMKTCFSGDTWF